MLFTGVAPPQRASPKKTLASGLMATSFLFLPDGTAVARPEAKNDSTLPRRYETRT